MSRRRGPSVVLGLLVAFGLFAFSLPLKAQEAPRPGTVILDLKQAIEMAVMTSPDIKRVQAGVDAARAKKDQADAGRLPQFEFTSVLGPSPEARVFTTELGDVRSTDRTDRPTINGIFGRGDFALIQPLYTFGRISGLREAAGHGVRVEQARVEEKTSEVILKVKEAYYSLLLGMELQNLLLDIKDQLERALEKVERILEAGAPGADEVDRYKLRTFRGELQRNLNEVEKVIDVATAGLKTLTGLAPDQVIEPAVKTLEPDPRPVPSLEEALKEAKERRPEFVQIREGLLATQALVAATRADLYPQLFMAVTGSVSRATNRTPITNPFVFDELNHTVVVPLIGFKWHFDFGILAGKVREAQAEHQKVVHAKELAEQGVPFQVRKAYRELEEARQSIRATEEAYANARRWLVAAVANFDLGVGEAKEVADALVAFVKMRAENFKAIFNYNMALAALDQATGKALREVGKP